MKFPKTRRRGCGLLEQLEFRRLLSAGGLDSSFSGDGKATAGLVGAAASGMAVQSDGKIVEVGVQSYLSGSDVEMVRYNTDGTLDTSFGSKHTGKIDFHYGSTGDEDEGEAVAIQSDGKIVVAATDYGTGDGQSPTFDVFRFNSDGSTDKSFGSNGMVNVDMGFLHSGYPTAVAIQKDGRIVVFGTRTQPTLDTSDFELVRLTTNGSLDKTFGNLEGASQTLRTGQTSVDFEWSDYSAGMTIDYNDTAATNPDYGRIVVCGDGETFGGDASKVIVARFNTNGTLDKSFAGDGKRTDTLPGESAIDAQAVAVQGDGYVAIAGAYGSAFTGSPYEGKGFLLMEYTPSGSLNMNFGSNGVVKTPIAADTTASSIINGFSQRLIVSGAISNGSGGIALAAYTLNGKLDPAFGKAGIETTSYPEGNGLVELALGPNRTIVAAAGADFGTARFFDVGPTVSVSSLDLTAGPTTFKRVGKVIEKVPNNAGLFITRDQSLPFATRVYFTIGGSANVPNLFDDKRGVDGYTLSGMTVETSSLKSKIAYVDIPANQTFTTVTLTPENIPANNTTATFTINSNALYDTASPTNQTITILGTNPQPPTKTLTDTADAYVQDGSVAGDNFGTSSKLEVKEGSSGFNRISYLKFDLSSLGTVNSVKLNLFGELNNSDATNIVTQLFSVSNTTWSETGITFNNKPTIGSSVLGSATVANTTPSMYTIDVTSYVKAQLAAGNKTVSFALKDPAGGSPIVVFNSREAGSNAPTLTVS